MAKKKKSILEMVDDFGKKQTKARSANQKRMNKLVDLSFGTRGDMFPKVNMKQNFKPRKGGLLDHPGLKNLERGSGRSISSRQQNPRTRKGIFDQPMFKTQFQPRKKPVRRKQVKKKGLLDQKIITRQYYRSPVRRKTVISAMTDRWGNPVDPKSKQGKKIMIEVTKRRQPYWLLEMKKTGKYDHEKRLRDLPEKLQYGARQSIKKKYDNPREYYEYKVKEIEDRKKRMEKAGKTPRIPNPIDLTGLAFANNPPVWLLSSKRTPSGRAKGRGGSRTPLAKLIASKDSRDKEFVKKHVDVLGPRIEEKGKAYNARLNKRIAAERRFPQIVPFWHVLIRTEEFGWMPAETTWNMRGYTNPSNAKKIAYGLNKKYGIRTCVVQLRGAGRYRYYESITSGMHETAEKVLSEGDIQYNYDKQGHYKKMVEAFNDEKELVNHIRVSEFANE